MPQRFHRLQRRFILLVALVAVLVAVPLVFDADADPRTRCGTEARFYADAAKTQLVGVQKYTPEFCGCQLSQWGQMTFYREIVEIFDCY